MFCIHGLTREDRTKSKDGDERKRTMGEDGGEMSLQVGRCAGRNGGFWIKHGSANGVGTDTWQNCKTIFTRWQTDKRGRGGERMIMRMIWSFWEGLEAKVDVCHYVRLMHVSTSSHFPPAGTHWMEAGRQEGKKRTVGRRLRGIRGLFMPVPHIIVLICFNQSEPRGVGEYICSVWVPI